MLLYDPPLGWLYGFPKPYKPLPGEKLYDTLIRDGYPKYELDKFNGHLHTRFLGTREELISMDRENAGLPPLSQEDT